MRPKRFKGYWRALKSGKEWAVSLSKKGKYRASMGWLTDWCFSETLENLIKHEIETKDNWLLKHIPNGDARTGGYISVPFDFSKKYSIRKRSNYRGKK